MIEKQAKFATDEDNLMKCSFYPDINEFYKPDSRGHNTTANFFYRSAFEIASVAIDYCTEVSCFQHHNKR
jgi:hypothetical protein